MRRVTQVPHAGVLPVLREIDTFKEYIKHINEKRDAGTIARLNVGSYILQCPHSDSYIGICICSFSTSIITGKNNSESRSRARYRLTYREKCYRPSSWKAENYAN